MFLELILPRGSVLLPSASTTAYRQSREHAAMLIVMLEGISRNIDYWIRIKTEQRRERPSILIFGGSGCWLYS